MSRLRRQFTPDFKLTLVREIEAGKSVAQAAREHQIHPTVLYRWKRRYHESGAVAFRNDDKGGRSGAGEQSKIAQLERLIGQLTIENAFLKKVLARLERVGNPAL